MSKQEINLKEKERLKEKKKQGDVNKECPPIERIQF